MLHVSCQTYANFRPACLWWCRTSGVCLTPGNPNLCGPLPNNFQSYFTNPDLSCAVAPGLPYSPCESAHLQPIAHWVATKVACIIASVRSASYFPHAAVTCLLQIDQISVDNGNRPCRAYQLSVKGMKLVLKANLKTRHFICRRRW